MRDTIIQAIEHQNRLRVVYDGGARLVEPHAVGVSSAGNEVFRGYQVEGESTSGEHTAWKLFRLDRIEALEVLDETFLSARDGYTQGDSAMVQIFREL